MKNTKWLYAAGLVILVILVGWLIKTPGKAGELDGFATCIKDKGALFYGAFWCPHCQNQKALFGRSAKLLPYVECSNPDGKTQTKECTDKGISGYPSWVFADGTKEGGVVTLERLSELTSCQIPQNAA
ncbi:MAG: hypothetical protein M3Q24_02155 [bacterium]|nr:hypothetical protein [bacterium]